jgi:hypothetical protein
MKCNCDKEKRMVCSNTLLSSINIPFPRPNGVPFDIPSDWFEYYTICSDYISLEKYDRVALRLITKFYKGNACYYSIALWVRDIVEKTNHVIIRDANEYRFVGCVSSYLNLCYGRPEDNDNILINKIKEKNDRVNKSNTRLHIVNFTKSHFRTYKRKITGETRNNEILNLKKEETNSNEIYEENLTLEHNVLMIDNKKLNGIHPKISRVKDIEAEDFILGKKIKHKEIFRGDKLSQKAKVHLGLCGEEFIYNLLINHDKEFLRALRIEASDIEEIVWYNNDYDKNIKDWEDKSIGIGFDIKIILKNRTIHCEIKTSFNNIKYYTLTRNEFISSKELGDNYLIIKVANLKAYNESLNDVNITVIENPFNKFMKNIGMIKEISLYV